MQLKQTTLKYTSLEKMLSNRKIIQKLNLSPYCLLSSRHGREQPYFYEDILYKCLRKLKECSKHIIMKSLDNQGASIFLVPAQIDFFLYQLFNSFSDPGTMTLSESQFHEMLAISGIIPKLKISPLIGFDETSPQVLPVSSQQTTKILHCLFRHRDNVSGAPIKYEGFLRLLFRVSRFIYRRHHLRDEEALNALILVLAQNEPLYNCIIQQKIKSRVDKAVQATPLKKFSTVTTLRTQQLPRDNETKSKSGATTPLKMHEHQMLQSDSSGTISRHKGTYSKIPLKKPDKAAPNLNLKKKTQPPTIHLAEENSTKDTIKKEDVEHKGIPPMASHKSLGSEIKTVSDIAGPLEKFSNKTVSDITGPLEKFSNKTVSDIKGPLEKFSNKTVSDITGPLEKFSNKTVSDITGPLEKFSNKTVSDITGPVKKFSNSSALLGKLAQPFQLKMITSKSEGKKKLLIKKEIEKRFVTKKSTAMSGKLTTKVLKKQITHLTSKKVYNPLHSSRESDSFSANCSSSIDWDMEREWLEKKTYEVFRFYADNKKGCVPMMTQTRFLGLLEDCGLAEHFYLEDLVKLYLYVCDITDHDIETGISFLEFYNMLQELSLDYYDSPDNDASIMQTVCFSVIRKFLLPLLDHLYKCCAEQDFPYHIVDNQLHVLDPSFSNIVPNVSVTPDTKVINDNGQVLPGIIYTTDGHIVPEGLVTCTSPKNINIEAKQLPEAVSHPQLHSNIAPLKQENSEVLPFVSTQLEPQMNSQFSSAKKLNNLSQTKVLTRNTHLYSHSQLPYQEDQTFSLSTTPVANFDISNSKSSFQPKNDSTCQIYTDPPSFLTRFTFEATDQRQRNADSPDIPPSEVVRKGESGYHTGFYEKVKNSYFQRLKFLPSNFRVTCTGDILCEENQEVVHGFTSGPYDQVIGPDGRPVWNARINSDGRIETLVHPPVKSVPDYIEQFPAGFESDDYELCKSSYSTDDLDSFDTTQDYFSKKFYDDVSSSLSYYSPFASHTSRKNVIQKNKNFPSARFMGKSYGVDGFVSSQTYNNVLSSIKGIDQPTSGSIRRHIWEADPETSMRSPETPRFP